jgi:hypothetical protein
VDGDASKCACRKLHLAAPGESIPASTAGIPAALFPPRQRLLFSPEIRKEVPFFDPLRIADKSPVAQNNQPTGNLRVCGMCGSLGQAANKSLYFSEHIGFVLALGWQLQAVILEAKSKAAKTLEPSGL